MDIYLKDISIDDSEMIIKWRNDISVKKYFIYQDDISIEDQTRWIKEMVNTGKVIQSIIYLKENDEPVFSDAMDDRLEFATIEYEVYIPTDFPDPDFAGIEMYIIGEDGAYLSSEEYEYPDKF